MSVLACVSVLTRSREGEVVPFVSGVSILQYASLKDWMSAVELQMTVSLADNVSRALKQLEQFDVTEITKMATGGDPLENPFIKWIKDFPLQALLLAMNIQWTKKCEAALSADDSQQPMKAAEQTEHPLESSALKDCVALLGFLADRVVQDIGPLVRSRIVHMITEVVHQRDVCRYALLKDHHFAPISFCAGIAAPSSVKTASQRTLNGSLSFYIICRRAVG